LKRPFVIDEKCERSEYYRDEYLVLPEVIEVPDIQSNPVLSPFLIFIRRMVL